MKHIYYSAFITVLTIAGCSQQESTRQLEDNLSRGIRRIPADHDEARIALVIGNSSYESAPDLRNPVNDAREVSRVLRDASFDVIKVENANRRDMLQAIRQFGDRIRAGGVGLFYYAGHGLQVNGDNFLVPVNASMVAADEVEEYCIRASSVLRKMESADNRLNIVVLDACRNNPFKGSRFRSVEMGLARMDAPTGTLIAYATGPGQIADDGEGSNGLYTSALLRYMQMPGLKVEDVFKQVRSEVVAASGERQIPWESSSLIGDFYFVPPDSADDATSDVAGDMLDDATTSNESNEAQVADTAPSLLARVRQFLGGEEVLLIKVNMDCMVRVNSDALIALRANEPHEYLLPAGLHLIEAWSTGAARDSLSMQVRVRPGAQALAIVNLDSVRQLRLAEEEREAENAAYARALATGTEVAWEAFLADAKSEELIEQARSHLAEIVAYRSARSQNTVSGWRSFLKSYPNSTYRGQAEQSIKELNTRAAIQVEQENYESAYRSARSQNTVSGWQFFLRSYPQGMYTYEAEQSIKELNTRAATQLEQENYERAYRSALSQNTVSSWRSFLRNYPRGEYTDEAEQAIKVLEPQERYEQAYKKALADDDIDGWASFLKSYPNGAYTDRAKRRLIALCDKPFGNAFDRVAPLDNPCPCGTRRGKSNCY